MNLKLGDSKKVKEGKYKMRVVKASYTKKPIGETKQRLDSFLTQNQLNLDPASRNRLLRFLKYEKVLSYNQGFNKANKNFIKSTLQPIRCPVCHRILINEHCPNDCIEMGKLYHGF